MDKIVAVIREHRAAAGSSRQSIVKSLASLGVTNESAIKKALQKGVADGVLTQNKASFLVAGETYEDTSEKVGIQEVATGTGDAVAAGDTVTISYKGTLVDGHQFDAGNLSFTVGGGEVVKGMDSGVRGMAVGGRRVLTIPASLGYGKRGSAPDIPPNATLVFDIRLLKMKH